MLFAGSRDVFWTGDFYLEVYPAYERLMAGDVRRLPRPAARLQRLHRAGRRRPRRSLTGALGGIETMVFRLTAAPGLLALAALGVAVAGPVRAAGNRAWPVFLLAAAGGALAFRTLAVRPPRGSARHGVRGRRGARRARRPDRRASVLLVVAVVAKQWAVLAILPAAHGGAAWRAGGSPPRASPGP